MSAAMIKIVPVVIPYVVTAMVMTVILVITVVMISVVEVPVIRSPWMPVRRVIAPIPVGVPGNIGGQINIPYYWPCCNLIICGSDNGNISSVIPGISGVGRLICKLLVKNWLNNIIPSI